MSTARLRRSSKTLRENAAIAWARDGYRCVVCGTAFNPQMHHRLPRGMGGSSRRPEIHSPANLLTLCADHHAWVENHRTEALAAGLLVLRGTDPASIPIQTIDGWVSHLPDGSRVPSTIPTIPREGERNA